MRFGFDLWLLVNYVFSGLSAAFMVYVYYKYKWTRSPERAEVATKCGEGTHRKIGE